MTSLQFKRIHILGQPVDCCSLPTAIQYLEQEMQAGKQQFIIAQNPEKILKAESDPELANIISRQATLLIADGVGIIHAARILDCQVPGRVTGIELFTKLLELANNKNYTIFLYGAQPETLTTLTEHLQATYPQLKIVGAVDGYANSTDQQEALLASIKATKPDFLFVALGSPAQEKWLAQELPELPVKLAMGVGGSFDVLAGNVKRAPDWMQRVGLEWFYRLIKEPSRLARTRNLPIFLIRVFREKRKI